MKKTTEFKLVIAATAFFAGTFLAFSKDQIRTYSVPKSLPPARNMADATGIPSNSSPVQWTTPKEWQELSPTSIRLGNFVVKGQGDKKAEVTITSFPGDVGGELANVNRWRNELQLPPITEGEISSKSTQVGSDTAKLYDFVNQQSRTVVALLSRDGATWFFKMRGDKDVVTENVDTFVAFLKTIRFEQSPLAAAGNPHVHAEGDEHVHANDNADPHAGIPGAPPLNAAPVANSDRPDEPNLTVPSNWKEKAPGMMVRKSFGLTDGDKEATVSVSVLSGDGGGMFANVNRWRGQLSVAPIDESELATTITTIDTESGAKGTMVDFNGTDRKTDKAARLIAIAVPHGGNTWYFKLMGEHSLVGAEKEAFIKFVQTARYP